MWNILPISQPECKGFSYWALNGVLRKASKGNPFRNDTKLSQLYADLVPQSKAQQQLSKALKYFNFTLASMSKAQNVTRFFKK
jgi:hypothetical protein